MPDQTISYSSRRAYQTCPKLYRFKYIDRYRPVNKADALRFGGLFHGGLETWWTSQGDLDAAIGTMRQSDDIEVNEFDLVKAEELMNGYHLRWIDEMQNIEVIGVEQRIETALINPETGAPSRTFKLIMYLDVLVYRDGEVWIIEHKTSGEDITPGSTYWQKLRLDTQISTYFAGSRALGHDPIGCIYDVIAKPSMKPFLATPEENRKYKKDGTLYANQRLEDETPLEYRVRLRNHIAENPDRYYQRGEVYRLEAEEIEAAFDMWQAGKVIRASQLAGQWPRNTDACFKYNSACDFWPVCSGECSLDDPRYKKKEPKQEDDNHGNATDTATAA